MAKKMPYRVGLIGLTQTEVLVLKSLERILTTRIKSYAFQPAEHEGFDIYIVNSEDEASMKLWSALRKRTGAPAILVAQRNMIDANKQDVRRPMVASRLLGKLDEITGQLAPDPQTVPA